MIERPSPNHSSRNGVKIDCVVLHADASSNEEGTLSWLANPESRVSYHYLVGRDGAVYRCVQDRRRAWHAGKSAFEGRENVNDFSLGVSFSNSQKGESFPPAQVTAGAALVAVLCERHGIMAERITTHAAVSPGRKVDPGALFPFESFVARVRAVVG